MAWIQVIQCLAIDFDNISVLTISYNAGRKDLYTAVGEAQDDVVKCRNRKWQHLSGANHTKRMIRYWLEEQDEIDVLQQNIPSSMCWRWADMCEHLMFVLAFGDQLLDFYCRRRHRRLMFNAYGEKQRAYDHVCDEITRGDPDAIVAYGAGNFNHASHGYPATPNKHLFSELRRRLRDRIRLAREYRSSLRCSDCGEDLEQCTHWFLKRCTTPTCRKFWDREVNAARNIRDMFIWTNAHGGQRVEGGPRGRGNYGNIPNPAAANQQ